MPYQRLSLALPTSATTATTSDNKYVGAKNEASSKGEAQINVYKIILKMAEGKSKQAASGQKVTSARHSG